MRQPRTLSPRRAGQNGMALIEALVGVLIFAFGVLGLVGLQSAMTRAQGQAKFRADAAYLGSQVIGTMWTDKGKLDQYTTANCAAYSPCNDWKQKVASNLPAGAVALTTDASTGSVALTITWTTSAEGTHSYVLNTSVNN